MNNLYSGTLILKMNKIMATVDDTSLPIFERKTEEPKF
jgi:hypothetical protein